jgi:hypothetical protein
MRSHIERIVLRCEVQVGQIAEESLQMAVSLWSLTPGAVTNTLLQRSLASLRPAQLSSPSLHKRLPEISPAYFVNYPSENDESKHGFPCGRYEVHQKQCTDDEGDEGRKERTKWKITHFWNEAASGTVVFACMWRGVLQVLLMGVCKAESRKTKLL